jgi:hypothetical protein
MFNDRVVNDDLGRDWKENMCGTIPTFVWRKRKKAKIFSAGVHTFSKNPGSTSNF